MEYKPYHINFTTKDEVRLFFKRPWYKRLFWKPWRGSIVCSLGPEFFEKKLKELQKDMEERFNEDPFL